MKKIATTITALMLTVLCVHAQEDAQEDVPAEVQAETEEKAKQGEEFDISKAFPEEEIAHKMEMKGMKVYNYTMSHKFADLEGKLEKFLGKEWKKSNAEEQAEAMEAAQEGVEAQGVKIIGMATYEHSEQAGNMVMLMQMQMTTPVAGGEAEGLTMVTLTHINM